MLALYVMYFFSGISEMSASERKEFLYWYKGQKGKVFDNKQVF